MAEQGGEKKRLQKNRQFAVGTPLGEDVLLLQKMTSTEELGRLFTIELELLSETLDVDFDKILGQNVTIRAETRKKGTRYFNGFVSEFEQVAVEDGVAGYRATLVPWLWFLTLTSDCRIFQEKTVPEIIKEIFETHGFSDIEDKLKGKYAKWEYCVQYRESDFNFISRLMEHEGIYYYFTHEDGKHVLNLADESSAHKPFKDYETIEYRLPSDAIEGQEYMTEWSNRHRVETGTFAHKDFDFVNPKTDLQTKSNIPVKHPLGEMEQYDYPGEFLVTKDGESLAKIRAQELHTRRTLIDAGGDARGVCVGSTFKLVDYPRKDQNAEHLVVQTTIVIKADPFDPRGQVAEDEDPFYCDLLAIGAKTQYRSERLAIKPVIPGAQTAIVVGKSGEEIWTDEHGRVKVQFHWDRNCKADETSSCFIRVAQGWAGKKWGMIALPRIGQEVIVEFLEGDPDRPIITGRVYNGDNKTPYGLPANQTMSAIKSNSSKGGGGFNEIRFEDKKDKEQIFVHAQKDTDIRVLNDQREWIGHDTHLLVKNDKFEKVENNRNEMITKDHKEDIGGNRHVTVAGDDAKRVEKTLSLTVTGDVAEVFKANHHEEVTGDLFLKAKNICIEAEENITIKVGGNSIAIDSDGIKLTSDAAIELDAGADITQTAGANVSIDAAANLEAAAGANAKVEGGANGDFTAGANATLQGGGQTVVKGSAVMIN